MLLTRDAILAAQDLKSEDVEVPEWGGSVRVRTMTGTERDSFGASIVDTAGKFDRTAYRIKLLATCIVDEVGKPLFSADDIGALGAKSTLAIERVFRVADRLNAMGEAAVEAAEKN